MVILLNGMSQGMPEIQEHPLSCVELVMFDHHALDIHAFLDDGRQFFFKLWEGTVGFQCLEQPGILDAAIFNDFAHAVIDETQVQSVQYHRVYQHQFRLVKCAYQILPFRQVYRHLAADGWVYLGEQRGRYLDKFYAP